MCCNLFPFDDKEQKTVKEPHHPSLPYFTPKQAHTHIQTHLFLIQNKQASKTIPREATNEKTRRVHGRVYRDTPWLKHPLIPTTENKKKEISVLNGNTARTAAIDVISSESMGYYNKNLLKKIYEDEVKQQKGAIIFQKYCK